MKKLRRALAAISLTLALMFGAGSLVQVRADGPQGQQDSRSRGPSAGQSEYEYLLWIILMWLLGWL